MSYHIDELRHQQDKLPSLVKLKEHSVANLFEKSLHLDYGKDGNHAVLMEEITEDEEGGDDMLQDYSDMPPLEGYTEEDYIRAGHKPGK